MRTHHQKFHANGEYFFVSSKLYGGDDGAMVSIDTRGTVSKIMVSRRSRYVAMTMTVDVSKNGKFTCL